MRSQFHGLMTTLLMFVPLLAVPFVAGFGVPWLAAKSQTEPMRHRIDVTDLPAPPMPESEVGQSQTARHTLDQLFAPVSHSPAVDLQETASPSATAVPPPHLRNASLVVSQDDPWSDPFENGKSPALGETAPAKLAVNSTIHSPQRALEDWVLKADFENEPPAKAPRPRDLGLPPNTEAAPATHNPFADFDPAVEKTAEAPAAQVAIEASAFEDPQPKPRINRDPSQFDGSRTLFASNNQASADNLPGDDVRTAAATPPTEPPVEPTSALPAEPPAGPPADPPTDPPLAPPVDVVSNQPNTLAKEAEPLTYQTARARLQELGIQRYYLTPDPEGKVFHFRCAYTPPDNPRISHCFEAEASEPLEAVRKVLAQVETWTARQ